MEEEEKVKTMKRTLIQIRPHSFVDLITNSSSSILSFSLTWPLAEPLAKIAFGSNLFGFLKDKARWDISLYPPEIMSKYILLDEELSLFNNSFEMNPVLKPSSAYEMRPA